jgi:hypothetical protein
MIMRESVVVNFQTNCGVQFSILRECKNAGAEKKWRSMCRKKQEKRRYLSPATRMMQKRNSRRRQNRCECVAIAPGPVRKIVILLAAGCS